MAVVTKGDEGKEPMADREGPREEPQRKAQAEVREAVEQSYPNGGAAAAAKSGFFHLYKPGQGYWTRMGTGGTVAVLVALTAYFVYTHLNAHFGPAANGPLKWAWIAGIAGGLAVASSLVAWYYLNKPSVVDFLIATESEMKKVNWTSRRELIGSTWVVIIFMFLTAAFLFVIDIVFSYLFHVINVLKYGPFA